MYLYIHGFNSSPASIKARQLANRLTTLGRAREFVCPALSHRPHDAMRQLETLIVTDGPRAVLVGSSLGGFYATWLAEKHGCKAVLVNPALTPHLGLEAYVGPQRNLYTNAPYELTAAHLAEMATYHVAAPSRMERYFVMVTTGDELLPYRDTLAKYPGAPHLVVEGSDHGFAEFERYLDAVIAFGDGAVAGPRL